MVKSEKLKSAAVVIGALGMAWLTLELAFKPFLDQLRKSVDKSDPNRDPDDDAVVIDEAVDKISEPLTPPISDSSKIDAAESN